MYKVETRLMAPLCGINEMMAIPVTILVYAQWEIRLPPFVIPNMLFRAKNIITGSSKHDIKFNVTMKKRKHMVSTTPGITPQQNNM